MTNPPASIREMIEMALNTGIAYISFHARGADIPDHVRDREIVTLKFSVYYPDPIRVDDDSICQVLTFDGRPYPCQVPFSSIVGIRVEPHDFQPAPVPQKPALRLVGDEEE